MYFSATIFAMVGFTNPTATALLIASTNFLFTLLAFSLIDYIGRRRILLLSIPLMSLGLLLSSLAFTRITLPPPPPSPQSSPVPSHPLSLRVAPSSTAPHWPTPLLLTSLLLFVAAYALGLGNIPWQQSELFPLSVRAVGSALATGTNWGCNFVVGVSFLPMMDALSPAGTMGVYAAICAGVWGAVWRVYPERMGRGLEERESGGAAGDGEDEGMR
jgi:MFS transporter, SP family, solute carrier family 2 (myo-inositol transporter), member 13